MLIYHDCTREYIKELQESSLPMPKHGCMLRKNNVNFIFSKTLNYNG